MKFYPYRELMSNFSSSCRGWFSQAEAAVLWSQRLWSASCVLVSNFNQLTLTTELPLWIRSLIPGKSAHFNAMIMFCNVLSNCPAFFFGIYRQQNSSISEIHSFGQQRVPDRTIFQRRLLFWSELYGKLLYNLSSLKISHCDCLA